MSPSQIKSGLNAWRFDGLELGSSPFLRSVPAHTPAPSLPLTRLETPRVSGDTPSPLCRSPNLPIRRFRRHACNPATARDWSRLAEEPDRVGAAAGSAREPPLFMRFRRIPPGWFWMGSRDHKPFGKILAIAWWFHTGSGSENLS